KGFFSEKCRRCKCLKTRMKEPSEVLGSGRTLLKIAAGGHQDRRAARSTLQAGNPPSRPESRRARFGNSRSRLLGGHGPRPDLNSVSSTYAPDTFGRRADKGSRIERRLAVTQVTDDAIDGSVERIACGKNRLRKQGLIGQRKRVVQDRIAVWQPQYRGRSDGL